MKNVLNFIDSLTGISKRYNIAINADFSNAPAGKITYASGDRSHTVKKHDEFLGEIEALTSSTGIALSGNINFIDLDGLDQFDSYAVESNHITAIASEINLRNIKKIRIHKFIFAQ